MSSNEATSREKKFEHRYSAGLLATIALLLLASIYYTFVLWPLKVVLALVLGLASALLIRRSNRL